MAMMFGLYYARVQPMSLQDHYAVEYNLSDIDIRSIINISQDYFHRAPYSMNLKNGSDDRYDGLLQADNGGEESLYKFIHDPSTGKKVEVTSDAGKDVLQKYLIEALYLSKH